MLVGGTGNDRLIGGAGADTYLFGRGDGVDTIDQSGSNGAEDKLVFNASGAAAIGFEQLWFSRTSSGELKVSVLGSEDAVYVHGGLAGAWIGSITAADTTTADPNDVRTLSAAGLDQLINAMAQMTPPAAGATQWSEQQRSQIMQMGVWTAA